MRSLVTLAVLMATSILAAPVRGVADPPPAASPAAQSQAGATETLKIAEDLSTRMTLPVKVNGQGPFAFVIDTGADRTVISTELATRLNLPKGDPVALHGASGEKEVETGRIQALDVGGRTLRDISAPLLRMSDLGADGMLGVDSLSDRHITLDFVNKQMTSTESRRDDFEPGAIVVRGKYRFGQLILVDAKLRDVFVYVILDTGAQNSIGNPVLRRMLTTGDPKRDLFTSTQIFSVTGQTTWAEFETVNHLTLGKIVVNNVPVAFASLHTFKIFGLEDKPALLLGMDILSKFKRVSVDFKRREVTFVTP